MALNPLTIDMRELWKRVRLSTIRTAVEDVIGQLEVSHARSGADQGEPTCSPHLAALQACCDELRTGCGMPTLHASPAQSPEPATDLDWESHHAAALERYRSEARLALHEALGLRPKDPGGPPSSPPDGPI